MNLTILISSAGRRVELINCFRDDAQALGLQLRVLATDCDPALSAACQLADAAFAVPRCDRPDYVPRLFEICLREGVDLIIPTIDPELLPLAHARETFAAIGTRVVVSSPTLVAIARDKLRTADFLDAAGITVPRSLPLPKLLAQGDGLAFPVILKRIDGSSSIGLHEAEDMAGVQRLPLDPERYLAQEKWSGREYTVNVYFDRRGQMRSAVPHWRCATRAGEVSKGLTERVPQLLEIATRLAQVLPGAEGPLCFQSIVTPEGRAMVFEINARFGGGFPLAHRAGARFTRWLLEEATGKTCSADDQWQEGLTMLRYDMAVFVQPESAA